MSDLREVIHVREARPTIEGAGVKLRRVFGDVDVRLDPFLLLDHFGSTRPEDYLAGFPWHPHRGIETITYMLAGTVEHGDSLGNAGSIGPGDVQWMTAGGGIVHQEMPQRAELLEGFQLWSNLPRSHKMIAPRYQDIPADELPVGNLGEGAEAKIICGSMAGVEGPVRDIVTDPIYADITLESGADLEVELSGDRNAFVYVYGGDAVFGSGGGMAVPGASLGVFSSGELVRGRAGDEGARLLLVAGRPLREPVAWGGPIVMNTQEEIEQALQEYREGTFLR